MKKEENLFERIPGLSSGKKSGARLREGLTEYGDA